MVSHFYQYHLSLVSFFVKLFRKRFFFYFMLNFVLFFALALVSNVWFQIYVFIYDKIKSFYRHSYCCDTLLQLLTCDKFILFWSFFIQNMV